MKYLDQHSTLSPLEMTQVWGHDNCSPGASGIIFTRFSAIMEKIKTSSLQLLQRIIESQSIPDLKLASNIEPWLATQKRQVITET